MGSQCRHLVLILILPLVAPLLLVTGCDRRTPTLLKEAGTTAVIGFPDSDPPVLSKALTERIEDGMSQEEVVAILKEAASASPPAKASFESVIDQSKMNDFRYDLTILQGKRKLTLAFRNKKLTDKTQEGLE